MYSLQYDWAAEQMESFAPQLLQAMIYTLLNIFN